jgi:AcrR family transcriptional regulator
LNPGSGSSRRDPPRAPDPSPFEDPVALAIVDVVAERGYEAATVEQVAGRAGVSIAEFERRFADKEECAHVSFEAFVDDFRHRIEAAYAAYPDWRTGLRAAAYEVADWMSENPNLIRFGAVEILKAENEMVRVRREEALGYGAELIDRGRAEAPDPAAIHEAAALMAIGSIVQLLTHRLQTGVAVDPAEMVPPMMYMATRPYVGEEIAREELVAPRPVPGERGGSK